MVSTSGTGSSTGPAAPLRPRVFLDETPRLEQLHTEQDDERHAGKDDRGRVGTHDVERLVPLLDVRGQRDGLAGDLAGDDGDRTELAE